MAGQIWATDSLGGFFYSLNLSDELREALQPMSRFRQFCDVGDAASKNKGESWTWDVVANVATQGGTLVETNTMPETQFTITQGTLTITEWGNSVPYTGKLEALSKFSVRKPVMQALRNDANKVLDKGAYAQFYLAPIRVSPSGTAGTSTSAIQLSTGTATITNQVALGSGHIKAIVDEMKERNVPAYVGDDYVSIAWPTTYRTFKNELETLKQYTETGIKMIFNGEIGRYEGVRFVEQTNVDKGITATGSSGTAWTGGDSDWAFFFGEDTVMEGIAIPVEMRGKIPTDFGRSKGVAWYALEGFGLGHTQAMGASEGRVFIWDSQA
jgi:N4-gp56 family major capsid protein